MRSDNVIVEIKMDVAQTASFITSMTYEATLLDYEDFPRTQEPVWILGRQYSALYEMDDLKRDVLSRLWFTYRKGFSPIGGTGPVHDVGWGCMLRCGQMMLAQALINRHLGRSWQWDAERYDPKYHEILRQFLDKKNSCYSIHQIASMGVSEGKAVGQWFGPNTVAQVIRKLAVYDKWSSLVVHIAMDNTVIIDDIRCLCKSDGRDRPGSAGRSRRHERNSKDKKSSHMKCSINGVEGEGARGEGAEAGWTETTEEWKPLLLVIPLRLGLSEINTVYVPSIKTCLTLKQSVGIIGGKPNHAHWFIGFVEDELVYLDPHTIQPFVDLATPGESDESYHCPYSQRMKVSHIDPSIAVGFYCGSEADFEDLCLSIQKFIISQQRTPMFELHQHRPAHWPAFVPYSPQTCPNTEYTMVEDRQYDTDEEFELL